MEKTAEQLGEPLLAKDDNDQVESTENDGGETAAARRRHARRKTKLNTVLDRLLWFLPTPEGNQGDVPPDPTNTVDLPSEELPTSENNNNNNNKEEEEHFCVDVVLDALLKYLVNPFRDREERGKVQAVQEDLVTEPTDDGLEIILQCLQFWIQKGQFLFLGPMIVVLLAAAAGQERLGCWALAFMVVLVPLWIAAVVFPIGGYSDVRFLDLLPMTCLFFNFCISGSYPDDGVFAPALRGFIGSFSVLPGTLVAKKVLLKCTTGSLTKFRVASLCFAVLSFFWAAADFDSFSTLFITLLQIVQVVVLTRLGHSPLGCTLLMNAVYPCLMRPFKELEDQYREDHQNNEQDDREQQARLERQYKKLGGRSSPKEHSGHRGEILFPIIMGILLLWSIGFLVWHCHTVNRYIKPQYVSYPITNGSEPIFRNSVTSISGGSTSTGAQS